MIVEALSGDTGIGDTPSAVSRREAVAGLIDAAKAAGDYRPGVGPQATAVIVNGAVDAIVSQSLTDPGFDATHAAEGLVTMLGRALGATPGSGDQRRAGTPRRVRRGVPVVRGGRARRRRWRRRVPARSVRGRRGPRRR